ncbi:MAG: hypothetical protein IEMM0006_1406 [bacterium]|nr:MAG: hypothetical protein IEMM0006_1406 [bacterium]
MNHKDLDVWKSAMLLAEKAYRETVDFPKHEHPGITSQLRKAAVSVPANIAEGSARKGNKELIQFPCISLGSLAEQETLIILPNKVGYFNDEKQDNLPALLTQCSKFTYGLIKHVKKQPF